MDIRDWAGLRLNSAVNTNARESFAAWLASDIGPVLRAHSFTKSGSNFHLRGSEGWGVINFQKSQWGSRSETRFTINVGVALDKLAPIFDRDPTKRPPESMCDWRKRIGRLMDSPRDTWWSVGAATRVQDLTTEVLPLIVDRALPWIDRRLTVDGFIRAMREDPTPEPFHWKVRELLDLNSGGT
jgi:hypothetical protein